MAVPSPGNGLLLPGSPSPADMLSRCAPHLRASGGRAIAENGILHPLPPLPGPKRGLVQRSQMRGSTRRTALHWPVFDLDLLVIRGNLERAAFGRRPLCAAPPRRIRAPFCGDVRLVHMIDGESVEVLVREWLNDRLQVAPVGAQLYQVRLGIARSHAPAQASRCHPSDGRRDR